MWKTVGFGGRVLDSSTPKYLNTQETEWFNKRRLLFAMDVALLGIINSVISTPLRYVISSSSPLGGQFPSYPAILYNAMVNPFIGFPIKGAIWYQGESNEGRSDSYSVLFPSMICDWRDKWGYDFPFCKQA